MLLATLPGAAPWLGCRLCDCSLWGSFCYSQFTYLPLNEAQINSGFLIIFSFKQKSILLCLRSSQNFWEGQRIRFGGSTAEGSAQKPPLPASWAAGRQLLPQPALGMGMISRAPSSTAASESCWPLCYPFSPSILLHISLRCTA